jgi:hypothetical protein
MLLASQTLSEAVGYYLGSRHLLNGDPSRLRFLPNLVTVYIDVSKLRIERRILLIDKRYYTLVVVVDRDRV